MVRFSFNLPADLKEAIRCAAKEEGVSMSEFMRRAIEERLSREEPNLRD
jgi:metal-responsive CopG/Arc/MetJ family transcriptional regulator